MNTFVEVFFFISFLLCLSVMSQSPGLEVPCTPGEIYEGPSCSTFTKCVERKHTNSQIKFDCPPGTRFNKKLRLCDHDWRNECLESGPVPPAPFLPGGSLGETSPPAPGPPGSPGSAPPTGAQNFPPIPAEVDCPQYQVDRSGVYDCPEPGFYPSYGDCHTFYRCINSMGCIVKGFYTSCPPHYLYDSVHETCKLEEILGPCMKVQDSTVDVKISPVIQLTERNMNEFFKADKYWRFMKFMPNEAQRIIFPSANHEDSRISKNQLVPHRRLN